MADSTTKIASKIRPSSIDMPATLFAPKKRATIPKIKKTILVLNIHHPSKPTDGLISHCLYWN